MVDISHNLAGTITTAKMPDPTSAPRLSTSQVDASSVAELGAGASVPPTSSSAKVSVEVNSVMGEVLADMRGMPPPVDIQAVTEIRNAIENNDYPIDYEQISEELLKAFEGLR